SNRNSRNGLSRTKASAFSTISLASAPVMATQTRGNRRGNKRGGKEGAAFIESCQAQPKALEMNGELLQAVKYLCNMDSRFTRKTSTRAELTWGSQHPRNLDPPLPPCYFPFEPFFSGI